MLQAFVIILREGFESFLIVATDIQTIRDRRMVQTRHLENWRTTSSPLGVFRATVDDGES